MVGTVVSQNRHDGALAGEDEVHELRVRISVDHHRRLVSLKVLRGKSLAQTVSAALDAYFEERARQPADPQ